MFFSQKLVFNASQPRVQTIHLYLQNKVWITCYNLKPNFPYGAGLWLACKILGGIGNILDWCKMAMDIISNIVPDSTCTHYLWAVVVQHIIQGLIADAACIHCCQMETTFTLNIYFALTNIVFHDFLSCIPLFIIKTMAILLNNFLKWMPWYL